MKSELHPMEINAPTPAFKATCDRKINPKGMRLKIAAQFMAAYIGTAPTTITQPIVTEEKGRRKLANIFLDMAEALIAENATRQDRESKAFAKAFVIQNLSPSHEGNPGHPPEA